MLQYIHSLGNSHHVFNSQIAPEATSKNQYFRGGGGYPKRHNMHLLWYVYVIFNVLSSPLVGWSDKIV